MAKETPGWEKAAVLVSALAALIAALVAYYQGRKMREAVQIDHAVARPFIVVEPVSQPSGLSTIVLQAKNTGDIPARVLYESGKTWVAGAPLRTSVDSASRHVLYPDESVVLSEVSLESPDPILQGKQELKIGFCLLYESVSPDDTRRWIAESWFFFSPHNRKLEIWKRDETGVRRSVSSCHIDSMLPERWFELPRPPWQIKSRE